MTHFERSNIAKFDRTLARDTIDRQRQKICYGCEKGFCKRKGRAKAFEVINRPGFYICQKCANGKASGKAVDSVQMRLV